MESTNKVSPFYLLGILAMGFASLIFLYEAILFGAEMPAGTFFALLTGLFFLTVDCYKKQLHEYAIFNGAQFSIYILGGLA